MSTGSASKSPPPQRRRRRWRPYETAAGRRPVKEFLDRLPDEDVASIVAAMKDVRQRGTEAAQHIRGDIYEVKADGRNRTYRILFAPEGAHDHVLLALEGIVKKTQKLPEDAIQRAEVRLSDWRSRRADRQRGSA